jgi:hypothetical protein
MIACSMLSASRLNVSANQVACSGAIVMLFPLGGGSRCCRRLRGWG